MQFIFIDKDTIGCHVRLMKTLYDTILSSHNLGYHTIQFFLGSPKQYKRKIVDKEDLNKSIKLLQSIDCNLNIFTHLPYLYNLCGSCKNKQLAFCSIEENETDKIVSNCINYIEQELNVLSIIQENNPKIKTGAVIHLGAFVNKNNQALDAAIRSINKIKFPKYGYLLFETMIEGNEIGKTFLDLKYIYDGCNNKDNIKICIDTCHVFGSGTYDLRKIEEIDRMFAEFLSLFPIDKLGLIHLNDSLLEFDSKRDRHDAIGEGCIWKNNLDTLKHLTTYIEKYKIPTILETYSDYSFKLIQDL